MQKTSALSLKKILIFIILATLVVSMSLIMLPGKIYGVTLNVGPGETYTTIQSAVNDAGDGDTIVVAAGTYNEIVTINKNITITGSGASSTIIDPDAAGRCILIDTVNVNINGFTITNGNENPGAGILNNGVLTINNCIIIGNTAFDGGGIGNFGTLTVINSTISGNTAINLGGGIWSSGTLTVANSTISGNTADSSSGIYSSSPGANAENNWWGSSTGPAHSSNPEGTGDSVSDRVDYNPWLTNPPGYTEPGTKEIIIPWVRDREMTCWQVWINEDNNFEFVFWWEYANNNWVKIYDMQGNEVFSIDMLYGAANFEADLPDGMYTVKTFHDGFETPIQEFLIGKP